MKQFAVVFGVLSAAACLQAAEGSKAAHGGDAVLAEVDGAKLTRAEFDRRFTSRLFQARNGYHEAERKALDEFIEQHLLERQAQKEGLTVEKLLEKHLNSKLPPDPSDDALRVYFEGIDTQESFDSIKPKIVDHLKQRRLAKMKTAYIQQLKDQAAISIRMAPPRANVSMKDTPMRGAQDAAILMVEYADYECPYCLQIQPALAKLEAEYKGKLAFAYKDVPLPMHANAQKAAEAAHCAGVQGKYWEMHDIMLERKQLDVPMLKQYATVLKLDSPAFEKCLDSGAKADIVKAHLAEAQAMGIQGTPSFFINGRFFSGSATYEKLKEIVDEELKAQGVQAKNGR